MYVEKRDDRIRDEPSYDYRCRDPKTNLEMGIEVKRLIKKDLEHEARLNYYFKKYTYKDLSGRVYGTFLFALDYFQIMGLTRNTQKQYFKDMKQIVAEKIQHYSLDDISTDPRASLLKISDEGSEIMLFLNNFSSADEIQIASMIKKAIDKFAKTERTTMFRIILLLEQSLSCRREKIRSIIEMMVFRGCKLNGIDEIYHLAIWKKPGIARVFPPGKIFESKYFDPEMYFYRSDFIESCRKYFH